MNDMFPQAATEKPLRQHQVEALRMIRQSLAGGSRRTVCQMPTGSGKCLGRDTPVVLASGQVVPVQDIAVGDRLASPTGDPVTVLSIARGREQMFRITPVKGDPWTCNASHLLSIKVTGSDSRVNFADGQFVAPWCKGQVVIIRADDMHRSSKTAKHVSKQWRPASVEFDQSGDMPIPAYELGLWLGDGTSRAASLTKKPGVVVDAWCDYVASLGGTIRVSYGSTGCPTLNSRFLDRPGNPITSGLRDIGVLSNKHIPLAYKTASVSDRLALLSGIFDTDGHASRGGVDFVSASEVLARDVVFVCRSVGLAAYVKHCRKGIKATGFVGDYWRVSVSGDCARLPTRRLRFATRRQVKDHLVTGFAIEPVGEGDYYGFELSGDRLFLTGDFSVTHNTRLSAEIIKGALSKGHRVIFTTPGVDLIDQTIAEFEGEGIFDIGAMQSDHPRTRPDAAVQVATVQTLAARGVPSAGLVMVDECHEQFEIIRQMMTEKPDLFFIGLSATPWARGMGLYWQDLVIPCQIGDLIEAGYLSRFSVYAPDVPDLSGVKVKAGEYAEAGLCEVMGDAKIVGSVIQNWLARGDDRPTLAFAINCAHGKQMTRDFIAAGISAAYVDAHTDAVERRRIRRLFRSGEIRIIVSVATMIRGTDLPVSCIIDAAPTLSEMRYVQKIGRGLRVNPGTEDCVVFDHAGNAIRLGLVTDIYHGALDTSKKGQNKPAKAPLSERAPRPCQKCEALVVGAICGVCGHESIPPRQAEAVGELVEVGNVKVPTKDEKQAFWSMALWLDDERKRGGKLAAGLYKGKFGVWPRGLVDTPRPPDQAFWNYEKSRRIAWAKRMDAQKGAQK